MPDFICTVMTPPWVAEFGVHRVLLDAHFLHGVMAGVYDFFRRHVGRAITTTSFFVVVLPPTSICVAAQVVWALLGGGPQTEAGLSCASRNGFG